MLYSLYATRGVWQVITELSSQWSGKTRGILLLIACLWLKPDLPLEQSSKRFLLKKFYYLRLQLSNQ